MLPFSNFNNFNDRNALVRITKHSSIPHNLNGVAFSSFSPPSDWGKVIGQANFPEKPISNPHGLKLGSGVIILEKDGRVWATHPTNGFGGYKATFPKGTLEPELSMQANAIKEAWEETGLKVRILKFAVDVQRTTSVARYYFAERTGGTPLDMGWESEAVSLVPKSHLMEVFHHPADKPIVSVI